MAVMLAVALMVSAAACGGSGGGDATAVVKAVDGYANGRIGDVMRNEFFEYTVVSANYVEEYAGQKPAAGKKFVDAVVKIKNIVDEELNMYYDDFQIQWGGEGEDNFGYCIEAKDSTMIPAEFMMKKGETLEYHIVYEVPEGQSEYSISYLEYFEDDTEGDVFFVYFELAEAQAV